MINEDIRHIIEQELSRDEDLLWAHVVEPPRISEERLPNKAMKWAGAAMQLVSFVLFIKLVLEEGVSALNEPLLLGAIMGMAVIGFNLFWRSDRGKALKKGISRDIFQNAILTNKRFFLFNHYDSLRKTFSQGDVGAVDIDFENGGKALRVTPSDKSKDTILTGGVDFRPVVTLIHKTLINKD